jgi:hypothetical protein
MIWLVFVITWLAVSLLVSLLVARVIGLAERSWEPQPHVTRQVRPPAAAESPSPRSTQRHTVIEETLQRASEIFLG